MLESETPLTEAELKGAKEAVKEHLTFTENVEIAGTKALPLSYTITTDCNPKFIGSESLAPLARAGYIVTAVNHDRETITITKAENYDA
ncbi:hypothetical protein ACFQL7_20170 [Halocatena marina]|uniref:Uncharacterized protein n=1 Tax=Halocatena marina TaxID=2934937 RepID=A0ABD5YRD4_9EURY|nr:hypothetical protein [Halocatena marina]